MTSNTRGIFIVIEGLDRSGKSTQASLLHDHFQQSGASVKLLKFPDRSTPIGNLIDSYLRSESDMDDHTIHLLFSANRWEFANQITALLNNGTTIICDRYAFSGIAFSASKTLSTANDSSNPPSDSVTSSPQLSYEWCRAPDIGLPAPDLTLFLDISPEKAAQERKGYGEERYENLEMQTRVRQVFERIGEEMGKERWVKIDAGMERDEVSRRILDAVERSNSVCDVAVGRLWDGLH